MGLSYRSTHQAKTVACMVDSAGCADEHATHALISMPDDDDPCQAQESDGRGDPHLAAEAVALKSEMVQHVGIFSLFFRKNTTYTVVGTRPELRLSFQCS